MFCQVGKGKERMYSSELSCDMAHCVTGESHLSQSLGDSSNVAR